MRTVKIKSDIRPDLGYIIIDAVDFDPKTQALWTEDQAPPVETKPELSAEVQTELTPPADQNPKNPKRKRQPKAKPESESGSESEVELKPEDETGTESEDDEADEE